MGKLTRGVSNIWKMFDSDHKHLSLVQVNVFLKGVNRLFWSDVQNKTLKYATLYKVSI